MDRRKPLLIGMNSPQSLNPADALRAWNTTCAGGRLLAMMQTEAFVFGRYQLTVADYEGRFDRINVLDAYHWNGRSAREKAPHVLGHMLGRVSVVCGVATLNALDLERRDWCEWNPLGDEHRYCLIPHPSGLTREYNDAAIRAKVGRLMYGLYTGEGIAELEASVE